VIFSFFVFEAIHDEAHPQYGGLVPHALNAKSVKQLGTEVDLRRADMGIAIDGETGCFSLCDDNGVMLSPHELSWLLLHSYATAIPGDKVLHTTVLPEIFVQEIRRLGGTPVLTPISLMNFREQMLKTDAIFGFDHLGRYYGRTCQGYYISFFAICWFIDFMSRQRIRLSELRRTVPPCFSTQELNTPWEEPKKIAKLLKEKWNVKPTNTIDGLRFTGPNSFINLREDRDYARLVFHFEAKNRQILDQMAAECVSTLGDTPIAVALDDAYRNDPVCRRLSL
jgi:phosphomannomutase